MNEEKKVSASKRLLGFTTIFLTFLFFNLVLAQPPVYHSDSDMAIELVLPPTHQANTPFTVHVHVLNLTSPNNGFLTNSTTDCYLHVYNLSSGSHLVQTEMTFDGNGLDWEYTILGGNYTVGLLTNHVVFCNSTELNDIVASEMLITHSGLDLTIGFFFLLLGLAIGLVVVGFFIQDKWVVVIGGFIMVLVGLFVLFNGIAGFRDLNYTRWIGILILFLGSYFSVRGSMEGL